MKHSVTGACAAADRRRFPSVQTFGVTRSTILCSRRASVAIGCEELTA